MIQPNENEIIGKWILENNKIKEDENCTRINNLIKEHLKKILISATGWETLFFDKNDSRFWELRYLDSDLNGGGPPSLIHLSEKDVFEKYKI